MERNHRSGAGRKSARRSDFDPPDASALTILRRYSSGEISASEAARALGPEATEHDVFAGILAGRLPLPLPPPEEIARQVKALHAFFGPHAPRK